MKTRELKVKDLKAILADFDDNATVSVECFFRCPAPDRGCIDSEIYTLVEANVDQLGGEILLKAKKYDIEEL